MTQDTQDSDQAEGQAVFDITYLDRTDYEGYAANVALERVTPDAEQLIEHEGRKAYGSPESKDYAGRYQWIKARLRAGEDDVVEHGVATVDFRCSRVVSHELVRHRIASYTQQSQRFREPRITDFIIPPELKPEHRAEWLADYQAAYAVYRKWRDRGVKRQTARYHLPLGSSTELGATTNFREWRHILKLRATRKAQPEMAYVMRKLRTVFAQKWPAVFDDLGEDREHAKRGAPDVSG